MRFAWFALALGGLTPLVQAAGFADLISQVSDCAVTCVQSSLPQSPCTLADTECLCTNAQFAAVTQKCMLASCTMKESLTLQRVQSLGCTGPPPSQQARFRNHAIAACVIAEIAIIMRIYSKITLMNKLQADDYFILVSAFATIPYLYCHVTLSNLGFGKHIWDITPFENLYSTLKIFWIDQMLYSVHLYSVKLSLLCFLHSIFPGHTFKKLLMALGGFVVLSGIATLLTTGLQCLPASYNYTSWDGEHVGHCNNLNTQTYAFGGINMVCDILILVMPIGEVYKLQVKPRQRIQLFIMFSLGIIVTVFSVIRLPYLVTLGITSDPTWEYVEVTIWSIWETELGMVCACLPAIRHLFRYLFPNAMASIASKVTNSVSAVTGIKTTNAEKSGSWGGSRKDRSNNDTKGFYELDERSLIGKGPEVTITAKGSNEHV